MKEGMPTAFSYAPLTIRYTPQHELHSTLTGLLMKEHPCLICKRCDRLAGKRTLTFNAHGRGMEGLDGPAYELQ
eukprot:scaffold22035_cov18-Tisochrysis_lutea.AAC.1